VKNQYYGDINDYRKYGLLRVLSNGGAISTAVCWMLTDADTRNDGQFVTYLRQPERWRAYDPPLFDALARSLATPEGRNVAQAKETSIIPRASYYDDLLTDAATIRRAYFERFLDAAQGSDLVFFDPDNGLEVRSKPPGGKDSNKYLYYDELARTFAANHSVLVYQHFPRIERGAYLEMVAGNLRERTGASEILSFRTANVAFLLIPQQQHRAYFEERSEQVRATWGNQLTVASHSSPV